MACESPYPVYDPGNRQAYMEYALEKARLSPPASTKFCVGAVLVNGESGKILSTGYSMELPGDRPGDPGSTHAEQCCLIKVAEKHNVPDDRVGQILPKNTVLYTTMEPCNERLSGNRTCVERILGLKNSIKLVYVGITEPGTFIGLNEGRKRREEAGVEVRQIEDKELRDRIFKASTAGHDQ